MPKAGVTRSRRERAVSDAEAAAKRPTKDGRKRSPLADYLRRPSAALERELIRAASNGELTTHDIQAAIAAQITAARKLLPVPGRQLNEENAAKKAEAADRQRPAHVLIKQLVESLKEVVVEQGGGGPLLVVEVHWPELYAKDDPGEDVRLRAPTEAKS